MGTASVWTVVIHPAAFIEHLPTVLLCAARGGAWGWETKPHTIPSLQKHTELIPGFIWWNLTEVMGLLLHHPFSSRSGQSSVLVQASFRSPESHKPPNSLSLQVIYLPECLLCYPSAPPHNSHHVQPLFSTHKYTTLSRETAFWSTIH